MQLKNIWQGRDAWKRGGDQEKRTDLNCDKISSTGAEAMENATALGDVVVTALREKLEFGCVLRVDTNGRPQHCNCFQGIDFYLLRICPLFASESNLQALRRGEWANWLMGYK